MKMGCVVKGHFIEMPINQSLEISRLKQPINMNISTNLGGRKAPALAQEDLSPACTSSEIYLSDVGICLRLYPDSRTRKK